VRTASGSFEVLLDQRETSQAEGAGAVARLAIDKTYSGDLVGRGRGQMLSCRTETESSAGYVAIELVEAILEGRTGTFVIQHSGRIDRGAPTLNIDVIPDSGSGELIGLTGTMTIEVDDGGNHNYVLSYEISD